MRVLISLIIVLSHMLPKEELIVSEKVLSVSGHTSIGGFTCDYYDRDFKDTLIINSYRSRDQKDLVFEIPVKEFSCGNFILNKDFRKTIKAEEFPIASIKVRNVHSKGKNYTCDLDVDLAGKKLKYKDLILHNSNNQLDGNLVLSFNELHLKPPHKLGGLIKIDEELVLKFSLRFF